MYTIFFSTHYQSMEKILSNSLKNLSVIVFFNNNLNRKFNQKSTISFSQKEVTLFLPNFALEDISLIPMASI